jgi:hypothetical protein
MVSVPAGYVRIRSQDGDAEGVALDVVAAPLSTVLASGTVYAHAAAASGRRTLDGGRGPVYAMPIGGIAAVVRHARHGGLLARLTGDLYLAPTRAPYELATSIRLREAGVATPEVLAYARYRVGPRAAAGRGGLRRVDIVTREIPGGCNLAACLSPIGADGNALGVASRDRRPAVWEAVRALIDAMSRVGAYHADLNVRNVLITDADGSAPIAHALDIDRVIWRRPGDPAVARANTARLDRSARKEGLR